MTTKKDQQPAHPRGDDKTTNTHPRFGWDDESLKSLEVIRDDKTVAGGQNKPDTVKKEK